MFGKLVRELRGLNISQRELALKIGVSHSYISKLESSIDSNVPDDIIDKLSKALSCDKTVMYIACGKIPPDHFDVDENAPSIYGEIERFIRANYSKMNSSNEELEVFFNIFNQSKTIIFLIDSQNLELMFYNISASLFLKKRFPDSEVSEIWAQNFEYAKKLCQYTESQSLMLNSNIRGSTSLIELNLDPIQLKNHQYLLIQVFEINSDDRINEFTLNNKDHFTNIFGNSLIGIIVFRHHSDDSYGEIIQVNQATCNLLGYSSSELIGMNGTNSFEPQDSNSLLRLKKLMQNRHHHDISVFRTKESHYIPVEVHSHVGQMGNSPFIMMFCKDLSQSKNLKVSG